jgi:hypothetical protein
MSEPKEVTEKTVKETYRLPVSDVEFIQQLADLQILGANRSAVLRTLVAYAIKDLIEKDFIRKTLETRALLKKEG